MSKDRPPPDTEEGKGPLSGDDPGSYAAQEATAGGRSCRQGSTATGGGGRWAATPRPCGNCQPPCAPTCITSASTASARTSTAARRSCRKPSPAPSISSNSTTPPAATTTSSPG